MGMAPPFPLRLRRTAVAVALVLLAAWPAIGRAAWPVFHADSRHSGVADTTVVADSIVAWTFATDDSIIQSSPVIALDGTIYVGTLGRRLLAITPWGGLRWSWLAPGNFRHSTPAIAADGTVYVGDSGGQLHALRPDGTAAWHYTAGGAFKSAPAIGSDGTIYAGSDDGKLYAIWPNGTLRWTFSAGDTIRNAPALASDGTIYFGSDDHYLYAVNPVGTLKWRALTGDRIKYASPAVAPSGNVIVGSYDRFVYAFSPAGAFLWAYFTNNAIRGTPAITSSGTIYVGSGPKLFALSPTGALLWSYNNTLGEVESSPAFAAGSQNVCFGDDGGMLHVLHAADGSSDWTARLASPIRSSPAIAGGRLFVAEGGGRVWAFGPTPTTGVDTPPRTLAVPLRATPNPSHGTVTFTAGASQTGPARLVLFDLNGRRVADLPIGPRGSVTWDGHDRAGRRLEPGVYLFGLAGARASGRLVLLPAGGNAR